MSASETRRTYLKSHRTPQSGLLGGSNIMTADSH